ncbi:hypothetical protein ACLK2G_00520 [Escherichia coli]
MSLRTIGLLVGMTTVSSIDSLEFKGFGIRSTGHARQLVVQTEVVLEGDGGQGLVLVLDLDPFLRLNRR